MTGELRWYHGLAVLKQLFKAFLFNIIGMYKKIDPKMNFPRQEEEILKFWEENKIFEKSLEIRQDSKLYSFYDGPPFATGTPHYGHIVASIMKDVVPRYWTMRGYKVPRKWGWDCHGLPIENIAEKELGITHKKQIEEMGVAKFNETCRSKVLSYVAEWKKVINRLGRWADMENAYKTMDLPFMESVWWVFKELWDKDLIYEGYRSMHICTRCETTLSQSEVAEGYKDIKDLSAIAKFELADEQGTFILAWTTTPWTLIGNVALAIGENIDYAKVKINDEFLILAKANLSSILKDKDYEIINEFKGKDLIGKSYKPLFNYYRNKGLQNEERGFQIYPADFVTTVDGTGVVHIAPAFGEDDLNLGQKYKLPFIQHVGMDGIIKSEAVDFAGLSVKPIKDHQSTDVEIIKYLAKNNLLFAKEKYEHSYPHCWRCDTPLINYATSSWFVKVTEIKNKMLKLAKDINWVPKHMKDGRFGNWLESARDWSISRQRYWASVIPIWKCDKCAEIKVIGSINEIKEQFGNPNFLYLIRHGQAENNIKRIIMAHPKEGKNPLSEKGKNQIEKTAEYLADKKIDIIFCSPLQRTKETAEIISKNIKAEIIFDERLTEVECGKFEGKDYDEYLSSYPQGLNPDRIDSMGVEGVDDIRDRLNPFINEMNEKYQGKNIVVVSHGGPIRVMQGILLNWNKEAIMNNIMPRNGRFIRLYSKPVDLHKHVVDKIKFSCKKCGGIMQRIPDVLDTWFDSGSMPYAQAHYPFESKEEFEKSFPAEFIAEGVDQTRAWFYYLHTIATGIKKSRAYNNVVVNGIVLAEDGKKMSKRLQNYPDPMEIFNKYGADALRFYLLSSPVMAAENINFKETEVAEVVRGMLRMLWNSYSFFVLYANIDKWEAKNEKLKTTNLLDRWIVSELNLLIGEVNKGMENYELNKTVRLFPKFIDNLSNWYIRRSRKRFWKSEDDADKNNAYQTLWTVLVELSKLMAPFTPFIAEEIYKNLTGEESVHLADFSEADKNLIDEKLNEEMSNVRNIISESLQLRANAKIKVRQPLSELRITNYEFRSDFLEIIKEEVNVKEIIIAKDEAQKIELNTEITEDLKMEGMAREIIRFIQEMRKEAGYEVDNRIQVGYSGESATFQKFRDMVSKEVLANELRKGEIEDADLEKEFEAENEQLKIYIKR